ncbi:BTB domain-containing protein [Aphelenchoides bicaudatus]|nr:BTB domain-containing protein [Aphelenchoides bicaudatus]
MGIYEHSRKKFLFRALFADESEDESLTNQGEQVIEACTLDGRCVLMTLNRDGSVCAPGATMLEDTEVVQLNVGGSRYTTTKATLTSREPESFFSQLLQADEVNDLPEPWRSAACRLDTGAYFIDRDGELFAYVLDFLRNGKLLLPENFKEISRLREETLFYQLEGMHGQIMPYFSMRYPARNGVSHANGSSVTSALETGTFVQTNYKCHWPRHVNFLSGILIVCTLISFVFGIVNQSKKPFWRPMI